MALMNPSLSAMVGLRRITRESAITPLYPSKLVPSFGSSILRKIRVQSVFHPWLNIEYPWLVRDGRANRIPQQIDCPAGRAAGAKILAECLAARIYGQGMRWLVGNWRELIPFPWLNMALAIIAVLCGSIVGAERERKEKPAGFRTLTLVSLGSAVFTMMAFTFPGSDPTRIVSQIVTGVGFL